MVVDSGKKHRGRPKSPLGVSDNLYCKILSPLIEGPKTFSELVRGHNRTRAARVLKDAEKRGFVRGYREGKKVVYYLVKSQPNEEDFDRPIYDAWDEGWIAIMREARLIMKVRAIFEFSSWVVGSMPRARIAYDLQGLFLIDGGKKIALRLPKGIGYEDLPPSGTNIYSLLQRAARYYGREFFDELPSHEMIERIKEARKIIRKSGPTPRFVKQASALVYTLWVNRKMLEPYLSRKVWVF